MNKFKIFISTLLLCVSLNTLSSSDVFDQAISSLDKSLKEGSNVVMVTALNRSLELYKSNPNVNYLKRILSRFDKILLKDQSYFLIENFLGIYMKDKKKFEEYLESSLSKENKELFLKHLKQIINEMENGNG